MNVLILGGDAETSYRLEQDVCAPVPCCLRPGT